LVLVIAGRVRLHQAELEETVRAGSVIAAASRTEPGCIEYRYAIDIEDPLVLQLFEHWESAAALQAHFATPHFLAFSEVLLRAADGAAEFTRFEVSTAAPLFGCCFHKCGE
jgi:quinol monooxygenase YgiN